MISTETLKYLQHQQALLDSYINQKWGLDAQQTYMKRKVALLIELGEFINEQRDFKFWSHKPQSPLNVLLEEYIDCVHFIISLSLDLGIDLARDYHYVELDSAKLSLTEMYLHIYRLFAAFDADNGVYTYLALFNYFLNIGQRLGFNEQLILEAYKQKNQQNFARQDNNY